MTNTHAVPERILAIDAAQSQATVALVDLDAMVSVRCGCPPPGLAELLAVWVGEVLAEAAWSAGSLDAIAVTIGPGSFTGLRASIALAQGIGLAAGVPVHGITMGAAFAATAPGLIRPLWIALTARRGRVFIERNGIAAGFDDAAVPMPDGAIALAGEQADAVASRLTARGADVMSTGIRNCAPGAIASALRQHAAVGLPLRPALPLYIDPPEAKLPSGGLRAAPV